MHPGWAGVAGFTAASLARHGFVGPREAYEGRFGLFASHLGAHATDIDLSLATAGLGETWEVARVAVKPIPACHFTHACADAAAILRGKHGSRSADIPSVRALSAAEDVETSAAVATRTPANTTTPSQHSLHRATALAPGPSPRAPRGGAWPMPILALAHASNSKPTPLPLSRNTTRAR